ncbi:hypothetical protein EP7_000230 [Isosphaeraceae bacterium EP7]
MMKSQWHYSPIVLAMGALILLACTMTVRAMAPQAAPRPLDALAEARIGLARETLSDCLDPKNHDDWPRITAWMKRIAETRRDFGGPKADIDADFKAYINHLKVLESDQRAEQEAETASKEGGNDLRYQILEAETWLQQARDRSK